MQSVGMKNPTDFTYGPRELTRLLHPAAMCVKAYLRLLDTILKPKNPYKAFYSKNLMALIIGIDDAGRGPVIGPMILAGILIHEKHHPYLLDLGVNDSKLLMPEKRESIAIELIKKFPFHVELTHPNEIDSRTFAGTNLNWIEAIKAANIINNLSKDLEEKIKVIVDCPSPNIRAWHNYLLKHIKNPSIIQLSCEHKADINHPSVSAASIIAKHHRELEMKKLRKLHKIDCGSGYCHDPKTQEFLKGNISHLKDAGIIRKSWETWTKAVAEKEQKKLF